MSSKKKIYLISENQDISNDIKKILKNFIISNTKELKENIIDTIVLFDLTDFNFNNKNLNKIKKNIIKGNNEHLEQNVSPIAIISENQKDFSKEIIDLNFEDFLIYPFFDYKIIATINNTVRNVEYVKELNMVYQIGIELSAEKNLDNLLQKILSTCCNITMADGGSIYTVLPGIDPVKKTRMLIFQYSESDTLGNIYEKFTIPINKNSISGFVASEKKTLNIEDCYNIPKKSKYKFYDNFDKANKYITRSMMTVPMINHVGDVIGVVQLVNRKLRKDIVLDNEDKVNKYVINFDKKCERIIKSLTSQAAVSLENTMLYKELKDIFDSFIEASALAVESRDPSTAGHSRRVSIFSVALAREINRIKKGSFAKIKFSDDDILSIRYAALLHDFGKIGVKEYVLTKGEKLLLSEFEIIKERFETIRYHIANLNNESEKDKEKELIKIDEYFKLLEKAKKPGILTEDEKKLLKKLSKKKYITLKGEVKPYLTEKELKSYLIKNGSLTDQERDLIRKHVFHSFQFLDEIPWPSNLKRIPKIAYAHHELMDGSGYPNKLKSDKIPIEAQILAVTDVYDALIATDRPYKKKIDKKTAVGILREDAKAGKLNSEIVELFISSKIYEKYSF